MSVRSGCPILLLHVFLLSLLTPVFSTSFATERRVLIENFTNTHCPLCGRYIPPVTEMLHEDFSDEEYIFLTFHTWWPSSNDPWYWENQERKFPEDADVRTRIGWYGLDQWMGVPSFFYDGTRIRYQIDNFVPTFRDNLRERLDVESPLSFEIDATDYHGELNITVTVTSEEDLTDLTLFVALCETYVEYDSPGNEEEYFNNMIDMIPDAEGTTFDIEADDPAEFQFEASTAVGWRENKLEDLNITVWVQDDERVGLQSAQAAIRSLTSPILLVDASGDENATSILYDLFGQEAIPLADVWYRNQEGLVSDELLSYYSAVVWHSFNNDELVVSEAEEVSLMEYLDNGGNLIMSSTGLCCDVPDREFYNSYLNVLSGDDDLEARLVEGNYENEIFDGSLLYLGGEGGAGAPEITPAIEPNEGSEPILFYTDGDQISGVAGITHVTDTYRTMTLAFPIESISGGGGTETSLRFMERVAEWLESPLVVSDADPIIPHNVQLGSAYPNPFNSSVTIPFTLKQRDHVTAILFDQSGRVVTKLSDKPMSAGQQSITFDASEAGLTSGIYFLRLKVGSESLGQKLVYLR